MIRLQVEVYNEKKCTTKVKELKLVVCECGCGDVLIDLGNESFSIDWSTWKGIGRVLQDIKDGDFDELEEDDFECDGCGGCGNGD